MAGIFLAIGLWCAYDSNLTDHHTFPTVPFSMENINPWAGWAMNFFGQFLGVGIGLILMLRALKARDGRLVADEDGIGWQGETKIAWDRITRLDASRLQKKGYLTLHYGDGNELTLDTWRLDQTKALVALIDRNVPDDKKTAP